MTSGKIENVSEKFVHRPNILINDDVRQWVKVFRTWNTLDTLAEAFGELIELGIIKAREIGKIPEDEH